MRQYDDDKAATTVVDLQRQVIEAMLKDPKMLDGFAAFIMTSIDAQMHRQLTDRYGLPDLVRSMVGERIKATITELLETKYKPQIRIIAEAKAKKELLIKAKRLGMSEDDMNRLIEEGDA